MIRRTKSDQLFAEALKHIPGGVNSPVRAFRAVGGQPFFVNKAKGAHVWDVDGNEYVDYVGTWGPAILGHAPAPQEPKLRGAPQPHVPQLRCQAPVLWLHPLWVWDAFPCPQHPWR